MEQIHRKRIDDLIEIVPCFIDMVALWPYLIQTGIFNQDDCDIPTWSRNLNNPEIIKDIFSTIKTRGPDAYKNLILSRCIYISRSRCGLEKIIETLNHNLL